MLRRTIVALAAGTAVVLTAPAMADRPTTGIWEKTPRIKRKPKVQQQEVSSVAEQFPGLTTGLGVQTSAGARLGTVSQIVKASDGSLQMVVITGMDGRPYSLMPGQISVANGVVVTH